MHRALLGLSIAIWAGVPTYSATISVRNGRAVLRSENVQRVIDFSDGSISSISFTVNGREMLAEPAREFSVTVSREQANRKPTGLRPGETNEKIIFTEHRQAWRSESFDPARYDDTRPNAPKWVDSRILQSSSWNRTAGTPVAKVTQPNATTTRLSILTPIAQDATLSGISVELIYEVYTGHPAIRKRCVIRNGGSRWLKLSQLTIEDLRLESLTRKPLAAALFGVQPSVVAFEGAGSRFGVVAASEVPSALRSIGEYGSMGYSPGLFEWVLGPGEEFASEPVFYYGYSGPATPTVSSVSLPLDRTIEGPYMDFVTRVIGLAVDKAPMHGPQWMTWAYFANRIDDPLVRRLAELAAKAGFTEMLLDDGWQKGRLGTEVDTAKFPDFADTCKYIRSQGLELGLWLSCFRDADSRDLRDVPDGRVLPIVTRSPDLPGFAMSFASLWRDYYVRDLIGTARKFSATYLKQDFTNIMYGDLSEGHESRTRKESLLRGLRGLLRSQEMLRDSAPEVVNELTHEIYWGTPGVPADLAALKYAARFHIPPNECVGANPERDFRGQQPMPERHAALLRAGCWLARQRFYSHRGLPMHALEFYGAATTNYQGSLTPAIQDRQVASWLMGAPVCFSGDLRTLTPEMIAHYRERLDEVKRLEKTYGIYKHFQWSGVPEPTDVDWHWWGKLNRAGSGAVVVLRGSGGAGQRAVNIPWVNAARTYRVSGLFSGTSYGVHSGKSLQDKGVTIALAPYGQDLLEISQVRQ